MKNLILILVIIPTFLFSQGWEKTFGGEDHDSGYSVKQTADGGYIITGGTSSFGNDNSDVYLIKTDSNGDSLWTKTFGGEYNDIGKSVQQTTDNGYIIAGDTKSYGNGARDIYLIKTDNNGDTLWTRTYGSDGSESGYSVQQTTDGGYIITGGILTYEGGPGYVYLIKTDSNGDTLWTNKFIGEYGNSGYSVQQTTDDGFISTGRITFGNGGNDAYLIKTDSNGDSLWTKTYGGEYYDYGNEVQQTTDGGYIITGHLSEYNGKDDVYLIKTDNNGDTLWTKALEEVIASSVQQTTDGGYIITGNESNGPPLIDVYLIKTDSNGDTLWTKTFGGENIDGGASVQQTTDGGYIIAGTTYSYGSSSMDVYLIKTDENGIVTFTTEIPVPKTNRKVIKIVDISGKEIKNQKSNQPYIEIYDDGSTEKKMKLK